MLDRLAHETLAQCSVTIEHSGNSKTLTLCVGGRLTIGRDSTNDIVLDVDGVSSSHAELHLRPVAPGRDPLIIRDKSRNGTGLRPGPQSSDSVGWQLGKLPAWERLKKGTMRTLDHGWQLLMPVESQGNERPLTVYIGNCFTASEVEELDGEPCEPQDLIAQPELPNFETSSLWSRGSMSLALQIMPSPMLVNSSLPPLPLLAPPPPPDSDAPPPPPAEPHPFAFISTPPPPPSHEEKLSQPSGLRWKDAEESSHCQTGQVSQKSKNREEWDWERLEAEVDRAEKERLRNLTGRAKRTGDAKQRRLS